MADTLQSLDEVLTAGQKALQRGDHAAARTCFEAILEKVPDSLQATMGLGLARVLGGDHDGGIALLRSLETRHPGRAAVLDSLGVAHAAAARFEDAETYFRKAMRADGFRAASACNLGAVLNELGRFGEAEAMFKSCLRRDRENESARYHLALCRLLQGDYDGGWAGFELRNRVAGRADPSAGEIPPWTGQSLSGKTIVLLDEQGLGDTIQFARYAAPLAEAGAAVYLRCAETLHGLLQLAPGVAGVLGPGDPMPEADFQIPLLSLPRRMNTTPGTIPAAAGYLSAAPDRVAVWKERLDAPPGVRRVGLVWAGNPDNKTDYKRSIPLVDLTQMLEMPGCAFFSLQIGKAAAETEQIDAALRPGGVFAEPLPFTEVAAAVASLDLLVTVDTSLAHLAGALGVPVWTMITHVPDWRWGLGRADTPWYESMRLYRQAAIGDWSGALAEVCRDLAVNRGA